MPEELQSLLDRIQKDGVDKAQAEANSILENARTQAAEITAQAEAKARETIRKAEEDAKAFQARAEKALEQSARDVVLSVGDAVSAILRRLAAADVAGAMKGQTLKRMLVAAVKAYCADDATGKGVKVLLNPAQQDAVRGLLQTEFAKALRSGLTIESDDSIVSGFRVSVADGKVEHDFTAEAVTDALCQLLRPHLAKIVRSAQGASSKKS